MDAETIIEADDADDGADDGPMPFDDDESGAQLQPEVDAGEDEQDMADYEDSEVRPHTVCAMPLRPNRNRCSFYSLTSEIGPVATRICAGQARADFVRHAYSDDLDTFASRFLPSYLLGGHYVISRMVFLLSFQPAAVGL